MFDLLIALWLYSSVPLTYIDTNVYVPCGWPQTIELYGPCYEEVEVLPYG